MTKQKQASSTCKSRVNPPFNRDVQDSKIQPHPKALIFLRHFDISHQQLINYNQPIESPVSYKAYSILILYKKCPTTKKLTTIPQSQSHSSSLLVRDFSLKHQSPLRLRHLQSNYIPNRHSPLVQTIYG